MRYNYISFLKSYILLFLEQKEKTVSLSTYAHMCGILQHFDQNAVTQGYESCNFTEAQIFQWMSTIKGKKNTIRTYASVIKSFFLFLEGYGFHPFFPVSPKPSNNYIAYDFTDDEINLIISIADNFSRCISSKSKGHPSKYTYIQFELPMFLRILFGCGLRREEAVNISFRDIDFRTNTLMISKTKSHEYRIVPMDSSLADILFQYCAALGLEENPNAFIFPGTDFSHPIPAYELKRHFNQILMEAGIVLTTRKKHERGPCIHCFRHAFAHRSFKKGMQEGWTVNDQIPWLSIYMGHKSLNETEKYLKFNSNLFVEEIHPFDSYSMNLYPEVNFSE